MFEICFQTRFLRRSRFSIRHRLVIAVNAPTMSLFKHIKHMIVHNRFLDLFFTQNPICYTTTAVHSLKCQKNGCCTQGCSDTETTWTQPYIYIYIYICVQIYIYIYIQICIFFCFICILLLHSVRSDFVFCDFERRVIHSQHKKAHASAENMVCRNS